MLPELGSALGALDIRLNFVTRKHERRAHPVQRHPVIEWLVPDKNAAAADDAEDLAARDEREAPAALARQDDDAAVLKGETNSL